MLVGVTIDPREYENRAPLYPASRMCRVFGYASKGLPTWRPETGDKRVARLRELVPEIVPALVFQDWPDDDTVHQRVSALLDQVDAPCRLTWRHEADRKREEPSQYRRRYFMLADWVNAHANGHHVTLVPTSTFQWTMSLAAGKGRGDWSKYHVGVGRTGVDVYADSWRGTYPDVRKFFAPLWRYRDAIGADLEFPEFGVARVAGDVSGTGRAAFIAEALDHMAAEGVTAVAYWDDIGSNGTDLRLWSAAPASPELDVLREATARYNTPSINDSAIG